MRINGVITEDKKTGGMYAAALFLLTLGIAAGSVYLVRSGKGTEIKEYLVSFFSSFAQNRNNTNVFKNSLTANIVSALVIFLMGFFRFGCIGTGAVIIRKGFITGFTAASFLESYGTKGMLIMLAGMPATIIAIPVMLFFAVISVRFSLNTGGKSKKLIFSYIFFLILTVSIFCVASLAEGYLTTTFMAWLSPKFT